MPKTHLNTYAAVDLGSNSFHMLVARREHGEIRVLDRIREMVRLRGGVDPAGRLDPETRIRALDCLSRFGQRLRGIPDDNIRAVGTQAFRRLSDASGFLQLAEDALGCPVDVIAGHEEARLVYLGVTQWVDSGRGPHLVLDIGGGSTELVVGDGPEPRLVESLPFGCVSLTNRFFADGRLSRRRFGEATRAVLREMQGIQSAYRSMGWREAIGSSGTIRSVAQVCVSNGWSEGPVTRQALKSVIRAALSFDHIEKINTNGLNEARKPVFIGGLAMLSACFRALAIDQVKVSPYALREGLVYDLLGRLEHRDPRDKAVEAQASRFAVDRKQATRVATTALGLFDQFATRHGLGNPHRQMLEWACRLHETGLALSHTDYHHHSAYLICASDMAGFSDQEKRFLATLVRRQRGEIGASFASDLPSRLHEALRITLLCLRLAWIFCRSRDDGAIPNAHLRIENGVPRLGLPVRWKADHPLTVADLEQEQQTLQTVGFDLQLAYGEHEPD